MCISQFIQHNPLIVPPETLLSDAVSLMSQRQSTNAPNCILVVAAERLSGILTPGDVVRLVATGVNLSTTTVDRVMTQPVLTLQRSQCPNIQSVWSFLQRHSLSYVPILGDAQELIGVIDARSLLQSLNPVKLEYNWQEKNPDCHPERRVASYHRQERENFQPQTETECERFFDLTPSLLCIAGFDGYFKRINWAFRELLGFTESELLAEPFINFVHPADRAATIAEVESLRTGKTTVSFENRYRTKEGQYIWLLWTSKPYVAEQMIYAAARDITERKEAEQALKESEQRWQLALRGANDGIWDWNVKTNEVFFSRRWKEMLGFREDEIGNTLDEWSKRVHPEDISLATKLIQAHFTRKNPFYISEHRVLCKDGSYKWILDRGQALWDEAGNVIRMAGSHTDISERKQAEIQLRQERDFSNTVINTVGALVAVLDRRGRIINFNRTCKQITGYTLAEVKGKAMWEFLLVPEEEKVVRDVFEQLLAGQVSNQSENHWIAKDGSRHLISWSNTTLFDERGTVEFIIATGIDITEQRRVWNQLERQYLQTRLLADITRKIRMFSDLDKILQTAVTEVQHLLTCDRVLIVELRDNNTAVPISESILLNLPSMLDYELADPLLVGEYLPTRYRQGKILAINDLSTASISDDIKQLLAEFQVKAELVVPILSQNQLEGLLVAHQCHHPRTWQKHEIQLLNQLANQIGVALSHAKLLDRLEEMVSERTLELTTTNQLLQAEIAERQQTEVALRENQQKLAGILDNADEAIISVNEQQQIQLFNQGAEKIFGYQAEEIIGQPLDILLPEGFRQAHHQHIRQFGESAEQSRTMNNRNSNVYGLRKNGAEFPAEASVSKLRTREGLLFTVMLKDITDRVQAEQKLEASQTLLAKAEKIAKIGSWEYNLATKQLSWSEELFEILEFPQDGSIPLCGKILQRIHPEDYELVKTTFQKGHREGKPWQFNYRWVLPNGTVKYLESRGEPTLDCHGQVINVWGTMMDISDRIQAEKSRQRSEEQLQLITDALPVLIAYIDDRQRYLYNNRTYETWFGKPRSTLSGKTIQELFGEDNYQKMLPYIETALAGKAVTFEMQMTNRSGNTYWLNATYIPDFDAQGKVKGFFSLVDDITDRKEIEQLKSEFVSVTSHEMRTPLTAIHGVIKLLCGGRLGNLSPAGVEMANMALRNSDRLIRLLNDVLDLERMESGRDEIEIQRCDSQDIINQAVDMLRSTAQEHQIIIETNAPSMELWADRDRIVQTLSNLISNAIKFSPTGSTIWIASQQQDRDILFTVRDRGRGVPKDKLETIFERFQQVDASDSRKKGGTGLGLAICRHIVEQHGGKIWAESVYGQGSTFFFTIPRSQPLTRV